MPRFPTVYEQMLLPTPLVVQVLGVTVPGLTKALECWAWTLTKVGRDLENRFDQSEWCFLLELLNGVDQVPLMDDAGKGLAENVLECDQSDALGDKWFTEAPRRRVRALADKIRPLDYAHIWAIFVAVDFFLDYRSTIDPQRDPWWTLAFRQEFMDRQVRPDAPPPSPAKDA